MGLRGRVEFSITDSSNRKAKPFELFQDYSGAVNLGKLGRDVKEILIITAHEVLKEEITKGFDKKHVKIVDGKINAPEQNVKPFGKIEYVSRVFPEDIFMEIFRSLRGVSPIKSGLYQEHHIVFFNEVEVARTEEQLSAFMRTNPTMKAGDNIRFVNIVPYAGKLERQGTTAFRRRNVREGLAKDKPRYRSGFVVNQPNGTYFLTARKVKNKYKFNAKIEFQWVNGGRIKTNFPTTDKRGRTLRRTFAKSKKGFYAYPSIVIYFRGVGLL